MKNTPTEPGLYWCVVEYDNGDRGDPTVVKMYPDGSIMFIGNEVEENPANMGGEFLGEAVPPWAAEGAMCPGFTAPCATPSLCAERGCVRQR